MRSLDENQAQQAKEGKSRKIKIEAPNALNIIRRNPNDLEITALQCAQCFKEQFGESC